MKKHKAVTLIELIIASAIFLTVIVAVYLSLRMGIFGYRDITTTINISNKSRLIVNRINTDLKNSFPYQNGENKFIGDKDKITFLSLVDSYRESRMIREYALVSYSLEGGKIMRLCRKNQDSINNNSEILPVELASGVSEFSLSYLEFDNASGVFKETDTWEKQDELPDAVRIKLGLDNYVFEKTIFL